jgi:hypothetical protein
MTVAEIVRTRSTTTKRWFSQRDPGEPETKTVETVTVRSIRSDRMDVSVLRDLVAALDESEVPGRALVEAEHSGTGHLVELRVMRVEVPIAEVVASAPRPKRRIRECVESWPGCADGEYDPRCCRFPKSCSCTVYDPERVADADLEQEIGATEQSAGADE